MRKNYKKSVFLNCKKSEYDKFENDISTSKAWNPKTLSAFCGCFSLDFCGWNVTVSRLINAVAFPKFALVENFRRFCWWYTFLLVSIFQDIIQTHIAHIEFGTRTTLFFLFFQ